MGEELKKGSYIDWGNKFKTDWAVPMLRTGDWPLDRSSMFDSKADAELYAKNGDVKDKRQLSGSSYVGLIITVYQDGKVDVYKINEDRTLGPIGGEVDLKGYATIEALNEKLDTLSEKNAGDGITISGGKISANLSLYQIVDSLDSVKNPVENKIYLVKSKETADKNTYIEYVYKKDTASWEEIGRYDKSVNLTGYATETWVTDQGYLKEIPQEYITETELNNKGYITSSSLTDYAKTNDVDNKLTGYAKKTYVDDSKETLKSSITLEGGPLSEQAKKVYTKGSIPEGEPIQDILTKLLCTEDWGTPSYTYPDIKVNSPIMNDVPLTLNSGLVYGDYCEVNSTFKFDSYKAVTTDINNTDAIVDLSGSGNYGYSLTDDNAKDGDIKTVETTSSLNTDELYTLKVDVVGFGNVSITPSAGSTEASKVTIDALKTNLTAGEGKNSITITEETPGATGTNSGIKPLYILSNLNKTSESHKTKEIPAHTGEPGEPKLKAENGSNTKTKTYTGVYPVYTNGEFMQTTTLPHDEELTPTPSTTPSGAEVKIKQLFLGESKNMLFNMPDPTANPWYFRFNTKYKNTSILAWAYDLMKGKYIQEVTIEKDPNIDGKYNISGVAGALSIYVKLSLNNLL